MHRRVAIGDIVSVLAEVASPVEFSPSPPVQRFVHHRTQQGTEQNLSAERGARASLLVMQPGQDSSALALARRRSPALK